MRAVGRERCHPAPRGSRGDCVKRWGLANTQRPATAPIWAYALRYGAMLYHTTRNPAKRRIALLGALANQQRREHSPTNNARWIATTQQRRALDRNGRRLRQQINATFVNLNMSNLLGYVILPQTPQFGDQCKHAFSLSTKHALLYIRVMLLHSSF